MGLIRRLEEGLEMTLGATYNEVEINRRVDDIIKNEARGNKLKMIVAFNQPPLFLTANSEDINKHFNTYGGSLEVLTQNPAVLCELTPPLPDYIQVHRKRLMIGDVKLYYTPKKMIYEFAVLFDYIIRDKCNEFLLTEDADLAKKYTEIFEKMKKEDFVSRYDHREDIHPRTAF